MCCLKINILERLRLFIECFESLLTEHTFSCSLCAYVLLASLISLLSLFLPISTSSRLQETVDKSAESGTRCSQAFSNLFEALQDIWLLPSTPNAEEVDAETIGCTLAVSANGKYYSRQWAAWFTREYVIVIRFIRSKWFEYDRCRCKTKWHNEPSSASSSYECKFC